MLKVRQNTAYKKSGQKSGFWLSLACALGLHGIVLFIPMTMQAPDKERVPAQIELQLTTIYKAPDLQEPEQQPEKPLIETEPPPIRSPEPATVIPQELAKAPPTPEPPRLLPAPRLRELDHDFDKMTPVQKTRLTNAILSRPFITEESEADRIFGQQFTLRTTEPQKEFHYPARQNMVTMLDQPMPDLPFAYTPDLIYFAYDPGVKGDLQRFWDVITPEFGWRTNNGTEFKCRWILVIAACGWK